MFAGSKALARNRCHMGFAEQASGHIGGGLLRSARLSTPDCWFTDLDIGLEFLIALGLRQGGRREVRVEPTPASHRGGCL